MGDDYHLSFEKEMALPGHVSPSSIRGATPVNKDNSYVGYSILNQNYKKR